MGLFKDLRDLKKATKDIEKEQYGTTNPFKIAAQSVSGLSQEIHQLQDYAATPQHLESDGLSGEATIQAVRDTGLYVNNMPQLEFDLLVRLEGREPYDATVRQVVQHSSLAQMQPGATVPVKVDAQDSQSLIIA